MKESKKSLWLLLENLSVWVKGVIGFLTALVGFVILFRDKLQLISVLVVLLISISAIIAAGYILTSKTAPLIEGGKGVYRYPNLRTFSALAILVIPVLNFLFFGSSYGKETLLVAIHGTPTLHQMTASVQSTSTVEGTSTQNVTTVPLSTATLNPLDLVDVEYELSGCTGRFVLSNSSELMENPFRTAGQYYSNRSDQDFWKAFQDFREGNSGVTIKMKNLQSAGGPSIQMGNSVKLVLDSFEHLSHVDVGIFSWGEGLSGRYIGFGCGGGFIEYQFPRILLTRQDSALTSKNEEFDYFSIEPGEYLQFATEMGCAETGLYHYHLVSTLTYGNEVREVASQSFSLYCPESYTEWWFHDVVKHDSLYEVHTVSQAGTYAPDASWNYLLVKPGWTTTIPWQPCSSAPESMIFPDPNSKRPMINPEVNGSVNVRSSPAISGSVVEKLPPAFDNMQLLDGPVCADGFVWWKVELHLFFNDKKPITSGWIAEGDGTENWLIVKREIPNLHFTPEP